MRCLTFLFLILLFAASPALSSERRTESSAEGQCTEIVKYTKNPMGFMSYQIPEILVKKMGYQIIEQNWREEKMSDVVKVTLKISAQKEVQVDSAYLSYSWNPEWIWSVNPLNGKITPLNDRARDWMGSKL